MNRPGIHRLFHLGLRRRDAIVRETDEEIEAHLALRAEELERRGMTPEAARAEAERRFGSLDRARADLVRAAERRMERVALRERLDAWRQDLRYAWRSVLGEPGIAAVVVIVIALGVGANAAMFGILDRLLLRGPEHVVQPGRLVRFAGSADVPGMGRLSTTTFGYVTYTLLRDHAQGLAGVAAYSETAGVLGAGESAEPIEVGHATADFFPLLGTRAGLGRFFNAAEDRPGAAENVAVIGYDVWTRRFGADSAIVGRTVRIGGSPYTVVGVAPKGFTGVELSRVDAWLPMSLRHPTPDWPTTWHAQWLRIVGRLTPGVSAKNASSAATRAFQAGYTGDEKVLKKAELRAAPLWHRPSGSGNEPMELAVSRWLIGVAAIVLLVACANVANLLLARALRRRRETGMRLALGISRARLARLHLAETLLLMVAGALGALLVLPTIGYLVRHTLLPNVAWGSSVTNWRVLAFTGLITIIAGCLTALVPIFHVGRLGATEALRGGTREEGVRASRTRAALTVAQCALSVLLLVGAGLFVRSLWRAQGVDLGFQPRPVLTASPVFGGPPLAMLPTGTAMAESKRREQAFMASALARAQAMPQVEHAAIAVGMPFGNSFEVDLRVPGRDSIPHVPGGGPYVHAVSPDYFATLGLPLLAGRSFGRGDHAGSEPVAIVDATMAKALWPQGTAIGQCLLIGDGAPPCARIVGIVGDVHHQSIRDRPTMQYYLPLGQEHGFGGSMLVVRPRGDPAQVIEPLRKVLFGANPSPLWVRVGTLESRIEPEFRPWRLGATLMGVFGLLALVIAAIGLYSLIAYMVANRTHEMGVRVALGARGRDVIGLVLKRGLGLATVGLALGVLLALIAGPRVQDLLFNESPRDPAVYLAGVGVLLGAALLACVIPARRAARVDPMDALRAE